jgi:hypothetical protein
MKRRACHVVSIITLALAMSAPAALGQVSDTDLLQQN